jgi:hypothetical protein
MPEPLHRVGHFLGKASEKSHWTSSALCRCQWPEIATGKANERESAAA